MLKIPDIDPDKVERYGKRFLKHIHNSRRLYENLIGDQDDRPTDPNHQNVVEISSDDDNGADLYDLLDNHDDSQEERSMYFQNPLEVEAFDAHCKSSFHNLQPSSPSTSLLTCYVQCPRFQTIPLPQHHLHHHGTLNSNLALEDTIVEENMEPEDFPKRALLP